MKTDMTISADIVTPVVEAAPGEMVIGRLRLRNSGPTPATCRVRTVGLDGADRQGGEAGVTVPPAAEVELPVVVNVPAALGIGEHAAAFEVTSERSGDRPLLVPFTVSVGSVERVELTPYPATIRARRRAKFRLDLVNHEPTPVELAIEGSAPDVQVRFTEPRVQLLPGQHTVTTGKLKGRRRWSGEATQHTVLITARGRASSTSVTAAFVQRPLFAARLKMVLGFLAVIALWLGAIGVFAWWWSNRGDDELADTASSAEINGVDTDGDGVIDTFYDENGNVIYGVDTDGDGVPDAFFDADGNPVPDPRGGGTDGSGADGSDGDGGGGEAAEPTMTVVRGTVSADGDITGISITMTPIQLNQQPPAPSGIVGFAAPASIAVSPGGDGSSAGGKYWSARAGVADDGALNPVRQSEPLQPLQTNPQADGVWLFTDVPLRRTYQLTFSKPGYDSQSFVVSPPEDGSPVDLDVTMKAAAGAISGRVTGPSGPLGGVAITVTSGSLTFNTTSATVGDVGSWSVEGLSTPDVYTIVGELRGFGTEVLQLSLGAGQTDGTANLSMRPGVGSISGRVTGPRGAPLGGVTVTATNGEESRTTSSLTEGDIGFFNIPQLAIPGTYTLTVEHDGYLSQTRRIPVTGAVGGIDFTLVRTTLQLTGRITSSQGGAGIPNAGLTLSNGDLTFKVSTAVPPNAGSFVIDDLPTGNYTVTIEHYLHETTTEFLTLAAGVTPPPLNVSLQRLSAMPEVGDGTLVVEVVDNGADTAEAREIKNATIKLVRTRTGEELPAVTQEAFNFRLTGIPVGTYTLFVTAPKYNAAPPRQVSVGLSEQRVEVALQRLGQASGRVVDSLDPSVVLNNYFISIYRQPENPGDQAVFTLPARSDGTWQTPPDTLIPGVYRIEINDAASPPGYVVRNDQLLDPDVVGPTPESVRMRFIVPEGAVDPVVVADIEADPYPEITGRIFRGANAQTNGFFPVDSPDLSVTMSCPGGIDLQVPPAGLTDVAGLVGTPVPNLFETFKITKEQIDANNLTGDCEITAAAHAPLLPATMSLPGVDASNGITSADRRVGFALPVAPPAIGGRVFWLDGSTRRLIEGAGVSAQPATAFSKLDGTTGLDQVPTWLHSSLSTTTDVNGEWDLNGQIIGTTDYAFTAPQFGPAVVPFTVSDSGVVSAGSPSGAKVAPVAGRFDVELSEPNPGTLTGDVRIESVKPVGDRDFDGVAITATSPTGTNAAVVRSAPSGDSMAISVPSASPGTWTVDFDLPPNHDYFSAAPPPASTCPAEAVVTPSSVRRLLPPGGACDGFSTVLVELGVVELTLVDNDGDPITGPIRVELTGGAAPIVENFTSGSGTNGNVYVIDEIPVHPTAPVATAVPYVLRVDVDGYDVTDAVVNAVPANATAVPTPIRAGDEIEYEIAIPPFGSVTGTLVGSTGAPLNFGPGSGLDDGAEVTVTYLDDPGMVVDVDTTGNTFSFTGPPGQYRVELEHRHYLPASLDVTMTNDFTNNLGQTVLDIRRGSLDISAVDNLEDRNLLAGPTVYCLSGGGVDLNDQILGGQVVIPNLLPGTYTLQLRQFFDPLVDDCSGPLTGQSAFPTITTVVIGRSTEATLAVTTVVAPLPSLAASLAGDILAENSEGDPVALPDDTVVPYELTLAYPRPVIEQARIGDPTPPANPESPSQFLDDDCAPVPSSDPPQAVCTADIDDGAAATAGVVGYEFQFMPHGGPYPVVLASTTIAALTAAGYDLDVSTPATQTTAISSFSTNVGPNYLFIVDDVELNVDLAPDDELVELVPGSVKLSFGSFEYTDYTFDADTNTLTFPAVPPRIGSYELHVEAALHDDLDTTIDVLADADDRIDVERHMSASLVRIEGIARQCDLPADCGPLGGGAVELRDSGDDVVATLQWSDLEADGGFRFDVPVEDYTIRVSRTGYQTVTVPVDDDDLTAGQVYDAGQITIDKLATVTLTFTNAGSLTASGVSVALRNASNPAESYAVPAAGITGGSGSPVVAVVDVPPGTYNVVFSAGAAYSEAVITPSPALTVQTGTPAARNIALERRLQLTVLGTGTTPVTARVFRSTDDLATATPLATQTHTAATPFAFAWPASSSWFNDDLVVLVSASGYRTQRADAASALQRTLTDVTLSATVQLAGAINSSVSDALEAGGTITATPAAGSGLSQITGAVTSSGYTLNGLTNAATGDSVVWTINYSKLGVGVSSGTDTVTVSGSNVVASPNINVTARDVTIQFQVNAQGGGGLQGATVALGALPTQTTSGAPNTGRATFTVLETYSGSLAYTISHSGGQYFTATGTVSGFPAVPGPIVVPTVTLNNRQVTVTVRRPNNSVVSGAAVSYCNRQGMSSNCVSDTTVNISGTTNASGQITFTPPFNTGSYIIMAVQGADDGLFVPFNVSANGGAFTPASPTVVID